MTLLEKLLGAIDEIDADCWDGNLDPREVKDVIRKVMAEHHQEGR